MSLRPFLLVGLCSLFSNVVAAQTLKAPSDVAQRVDRLLTKDKSGAPLPELCDDATFLRRVSLDLTGKLPAPDDLELLAKAPAAAKRGQLVERLLAGLRLSRARKLESLKSFNRPVAGGRG